MTGKEAHEIPEDTLKIGEDRCISPPVRRGEAVYCDSVGIRHQIGILIDDREDSFGLVPVRFAGIEGVRLVLKTGLMPLVTPRGDYE